MAAAGAVWHETKKRQPFMTERILSHAAAVRPMTGALAVLVRLNALRWPISYSTMATVKGLLASWQ